MGNIITGSPVVHRPVGDPLEIYADRLSGHYTIDETGESLIHASSFAEPNLVGSHESTADRPRVHDRRLP